MDCPKCSGRMEPVTFDDIEINRCTACGGMWFDLLEHEHLRDRRGSEAVDTGSTSLGREHNKIGDIDCPKCGVRMLKMVDAHQPHIWYEMCATCYGIYFDAGEFKDFKLETLADFFRRLVLEPRM